MQKSHHSGYFRCFALDLDVWVCRGRCPGCLSYLVNNRFVFTSGRRPTYTIQFPLPMDLPQRLMSGGNGKSSITHIDVCVRVPTDKNLQEEGEYDRGRITPMNDAEIAEAKIRLRASFLSNLSIGIISTGVIAPVVGITIASPEGANHIIVFLALLAIVCFIGAIGLHIWGEKLLEELK